MSLDGKNKRQYIMGRNLKKLAQSRMRFTLTIDSKFSFVGMTHVSNVIEHFEEAKEAGLIMPPLQP